MADLICRIGDYSNMTIVPLPTISKHIRERGFDHMRCLAKNVATISGAHMSELLIRNNNTVQVGASAEKRAEQAKTAYILKDNIDRDADYLLIDDV